MRFFLLQSIIGTFLDLVGGRVVIESCPNGISGAIITRIRVLSRRCLAFIRLVARVPS